MPVGYAVECASIIMMNQLSSSNINSDLCYFFLIDNGLVPVPVSYAVDRYDESTDS